MAEIYYVDAATGNDADTGLTEALAWATLTKAMATANGGDTVYVKGGTSYTENVTISTSGWGIVWISYIGYTSTPGDGGGFVIDATGLANGITGPSAYVCYNFENMTIEGASGPGFNGPETDALCFRNCHFNGNGNGTGGSGALVDNFAMFYNCSANDNALHGFDADGAMFAGCKAYRNGSRGFYVYSYYNTVLYMCEAVSNVSYGINLANGGAVINCTVDGDAYDSDYGILLNDGGTRVSMIINNLVTGCARGIRGNANEKAGQIAANNLVHDSSIEDYYNLEAENQATDVNADPLLTDRAGGDYTLQSSSPARNAGFDISGNSSPGMDIGAHQSLDEGSGGGRVVITG